jgi:hypothetical protein
MTCTEAQERLAGYVFDELEGDEREQVRQHVDACEACRAVVARMRAVTRLLREGAAAGPVPVLSPARRSELFRQAAAVGRGTDEPGTHTARRRFSMWSQSGSESETLYWRVLGLAAVMMLLVSGFAAVLLSHAFRYVGANSELARLAKEGAPRYDAAAPDERSIKAPAPAIELVLDELGRDDVRTLAAGASVSELADANPVAKSDVSLMPPADAGAVEVAAEIAAAQAARHEPALWAESKAVPLGRDKALGLRVGAAGREVADGVRVAGDRVDGAIEPLVASANVDVALPRKTGAAEAPEAVAVVAAEDEAQPVATPAASALARLQSRTPAAAAAALDDRELLPELRKAQPQKYRLAEKTEAPVPAAVSPGTRVAAADAEPNAQRRARGVADPEREALPSRKASAAVRRAAESGGRGGAAGAMAALPAAPPSPSVTGAPVEAGMQAASVPTAPPLRADDVEGAVQAGLRWLQEHQQPDGSWSRSAPVAMTGLGLLAFLAHGDVPVAPADAGRTSVTVVKAMQYLVNRMLEDEGPAGAALSRPGINGIATLALCEAYAAMQVPYLRSAAEKGLRRIVAGQQPNGGFSYEYGPAGDWDLAISAWQVQALVSGANAGLDVPGLGASLPKAREFLKKESFRMKADRRRGCFMLTPNGPATLTVQSIGTLALHLTSDGRSSPARAGTALLTRSMARLMAAPGADDPYANPFYGWYCQTWALRLSGSAAWRKWSAEFFPFLRGLQQPDGAWVSPAATGPAREYDRYFSTAMACICLQAGEVRCMAVLKAPAGIAARAGGTSVLDNDLAGLEIEVDPDPEPGRGVVRQRDALEEIKR